MAKQSSAALNFETLFGAQSGERLASGLKLIPRPSIHPDSQPRRSFPRDELSELARSISELRSRGEGIEGSGILQPLLVTKADDGNGYRLIAGERRFRAAEIAGLDDVPAVVVAAPAQGILLSQLIENLQRRDLPPLEEAHAFAQLMNEQSLSVRAAAALLGKSKSYLSDRLALLQMGSDVQEMIAARADTLIHAREIDKITDAKQRAELIRAVREDALSLAAVRSQLNPTPPPTKLGDEKDSAQVSVRTDTSSDLREADPLNENLRPAAKLVAQSERALSLMELTPEYRKALQREIAKLKKSISQIETLFE